MALDLLMKGEEPPAASDQTAPRSFADQIVDAGLAISSPAKGSQSEKRVNSLLLRQMVERSPPVRSCIEIIGREVTRSTKAYDRCWDFYPKNNSDDKEPTDAERGQYAQCEKLLLLPDRRNRRSFNNIIKANIADLLTYDDFFTSIAYGEDPADKEWFNKPVALYAEDAGTMEMRHDQHGNLGDNTFFCELCPPEMEVTEDDAKRRGMICPLHKRQYKRTAYVQFTQGKVIARWAENEMIHGHLFKSAARLNGLPILISLMLPIGNMIAMDEWFSDSYRDQRLPMSLLAFKGTPHAAVERLARDVETQVEQNPHGTAWLGLPEGKDVQFVKLMDTPTDMQSLDWYKHYEEIVYRTFGVSPVVAGIIESGKAGQQPDMQRAVNANVMAAIQQIVGEAYTNSPLFESFGITEWYLGFTPSEEEDELMEAQTSLAWANAAGAWKTAGYDTALDEDGRISPTDKLPQPTPGEYPPVSAFVPPENAPSSPAKEVGPAPGKEPANAFENPKLAGEPSPKYDDLVMLMKAAPGPRKIDRADAILNLRSDELLLYRNLDQTYKEIIDTGLARIAAMDNPTQVQVQAEADKIVALLRAELVSTAKASVAQLYKDGWDSGAKDGVGISWSEREVGAIAQIQENWPGVNSVLPEFSNAQQAQFTDIITRSFTEGHADYRWMIDEMKKVSDTETWKLARIARSEATMIGNQGRAAIYRASDPGNEADYDWVTAGDCCDKCDQLAMSGPYRLDDLLRESSGGRAHPNCRCTIVRRPITMRGGQ